MTLRPSKDPADDKNQRKNAERNPKRFSFAADEII